MDSPNLQKQLEIIGVDAIGIITRILVENDKRATGDLIRSLDFQVVKEVSGWMLKLKAESYFKYVDQGRRPGKQPPIKPIQSWIEKKGIKIQGYSSKQTAFVIARSIGKKGIKPLNIMDKLINEIITNKAKILKYGAQKDIEELIEKIFVAPLKRENQI
jgi:hypothetical protein